MQGPTGLTGDEGLTELVPAPLPIHQSTGTDWWGQHLSEPGPPAGSSPPFGGSLVAAEACGASSSVAVVPDVPPKQSSFDAPAATSPSPSTHWARKKRSSVPEEPSDGPAERPPPGGSHRPAMQWLQCEASDAGTGGSKRPSAPEA